MRRPARLPIANAAAGDGNGVVAEVAADNASKLPIM